MSRRPRGADEQDVVIQRGGRIRGVVRPSRAESAACHPVGENQRLFDVLPLQRVIGETPRARAGVQAGKMQRPKAQERDDGQRAAERNDRGLGAPQTQGL